MKLTAPHRRAILGALGGLLAAPLAAVAADAAPYPNKPLRLIVAFAPGGFTDIAARLLANDLSKRMGQAVVVDNRAGAAGFIGTQVAAQAAPDGYTLLLGTISTHAINQGLYKKLPYDPVKDFVPVSGVARGPLILTAYPKLGVHTVEELIAKAKAQPGKLTYGSGGNGTTSHLAAELFKSVTGTDMLHVPFRSPAMATTGLLGGQVDIMFDTVPTSLANIRAGKVVALGVASTEGVEQLPGVPAMGQKLKGFDPDTWAALYAPAGTPQAIVDRLDAAVHAGLATPEMRQHLAEIGMLPFPLTSRELAAFVNTDAQRWSRLIQANHIMLD